MKTVFEVPNLKLILDGEHDFLEIMFNERKELMDAYIKKGKLPQYPLINLSTRETQNFFRELLGYCEEEVFEAYEQIEIMVNGLENNEPKKKLIVSLEEFNEELADVNHFILEILVYLNIDYVDVKVYYDKLMLEQGLSAIKSKQTLINVMACANYHNIHGGFKANHIKISNYNLISQFDIQNIFQQAGRNLSRANLIIHQEILFEFLKCLKSIRRLLKNKYWKEDNQTQPNTQLIQAYAMEAFLRWATYLDFVEATEHSIVQTYHKKHIVNLDRLENGW